MDDAELTLHEAAEVLGVHYMTVYRYVRLGLLSATKVGGTWRISRADFDAFRAHDGSEGVTVGGGAHRRAPWAERLEARLIAGDVRGSWSVVEAALAAGARLDDIYSDVLTPALNSIGAAWASGTLDVAVEHRASVIVTQIVGRLGPRFARRGRTRGLVILGTPAGEQHGLPLLMAADLIRQNGWEVSNIGVDVPASSFALVVTEGGDDVVAVGMSVSTPLSVRSAMEAICAVRDVAPRTRFVLGGVGIAGAKHAQALGADMYVSNANDFTALLETWSV